MYAKAEPTSTFHLVNRPRVDALMAQAFESPLVTVIGGSGTGKTTAVADFVARSDRTVIWYSAINLDSLSEHFWKSMLRCFAGAMPEFAAALSRIPFSPSLDLVDRFLSTWKTYISPEENILLVLDNFHQVNSDEARRFLSHLLDAKLGNLSIAVISNQLADSTLRGFVRTRDITTIPASALAFARHEIRELLEANRLAHTENHVDRIRNATDGWPFGVEQYVRQLLSPTEAPSIDAVFNPGECYQLLQDEWFTHYGRQTRMALIKLALLPAFSGEIVRMIVSEGLVEILDDLRDNLFIRHDPVSGLDHFDALYWRFLCDQTIYISEAEVRSICERAGDWFLQKQLVTEAVACFGTIQMHEKVFLALQKNTDPQMDKRLAFFARRFIEDLPEAFYADHPLVYVLAANVKIGMNEMDTAQRMLHSIFQKYEQMPESDDTRQVLGEAYLSMAEICLQTTKPGYLAYIHKAYECLPNGSVFRCDDRLLVPNESVVVLAHCEGHELSMIEDQLNRMQPYEDRLYGRYIKGYASLYAAEAALSVGNYQKASAKAYEAIQIGRANGRHDVVCNAFCLLVPLIPMRGNYTNLMEIITDVTEYVEQRGMLSLRNSRDYLLGWIYLMMRDLDRVPKRICNPYAFIEMPEKTMTSWEMIVHCSYWMESGYYLRALTMISIAKEYAHDRRLWMSEIRLHILEALCHWLMHAPDKSIRSFHAAYTMAYGGNITTPFVQVGRHMRSLINMVRRQTEYAFDEEWLSMIYTKANSYAKRINTLIQQYERHEKMDNATVKLSGREQEVLDLLVSGLTREEISERLNITIHGVKRHITSLYNKLGAANRSEAIHVAGSLGLLQTEL